MGRFGQMREKGLEGPGLARCPVVRGQGGGTGGTAGRVCFSPGLRFCSSSVLGAGGSGGGGKCTLLNRERAVS